MNDKTFLEILQEQGGFASVNHTHTEKDIVDLDRIRWRGKFVKGENYQVNDLVVFKDSLYICITDNKDTLPTSSFFELVIKFEVKVQQKIDFIGGGGGGGGSGGGGTTDHAALTNLDFASSGHTGFLPDTHLTDFAHADIAHANRTALDLVSGVNTGDQDLSGYALIGANVSIFTNDAGYLTAETDPVFAASVAHGITTFDIINWNTAYGWGDHSLAGYLTDAPSDNKIYGRKNGSWIDTAMYTDGVSEGNVILIRPIDDEILGKQHQTFASAFAWIAANSPASSSNQWCVKFNGTIVENIVIPRYVTVSGEDKHNSFINGTVDWVERGDDWAAVSNKLQNCHIATLAVTNTGSGSGKGIFLYNVTVTNSVASGANHYIDATLCDFEGDYSSFTGTGGTNAKTVIRNSNISSCVIPTTLATAGWWLVGCTFGNAGNALTLAGQGAGVPLYLKDCYFESYATITFVGTINWSDCEFNAGAADIVIPNGVTFNVANTTFRSNVIVNAGGTLNSVDVVLEVGKNIVNSGTWTNKGESYNNASSGLTGADTQSAIDEVYSEAVHLDQTTPQTFTGGSVTGSGLLKVTSGVLGLDTNTYSTVLEKRHDWQTPNDYCGIAPDGSAESAAVWTITRIVVANDGTTTTSTLTNVKWDDRASLPW